MEPRLKLNKIILAAKIFLLGDRL